MITQAIFSNLLLFATVTTTLVAGLTLTFAVVIMPGIKKLCDAEFIRAFQVIDGIIQNGQPVFVLVWLGSIISLLAAAGLGLWQLSGTGRWLLIAAATLYFLGVQLPTFTVNVPRNNELQQLETRTMDDASMQSARKHFEGTWNRWNVIRTWVAITVSVILILVFKTL
ncbi:MAG: DUF1772 domain-containing protein [Verrucomicrobiota bacterium]